MNTPPLIHIFKAGRRTTMAGETIQFSEADLAASAAAYDPALHEAPLVIGHPATDDPAQGWVASLTASPRGLFASSRDVDPAFAESVSARRFGKVSSKFYRPDSPSNPVPGVWYLRHVGFLGATPPAVKGLDDPAFADDDPDCVCFQEGIGIENAHAPIWPVARSFRRLRDWMLAKFGQEEADNALPAWNVEELEAVIARADRHPAFSDPPATDSTIPPQATVSAPPEPHKEQPTVTPEEKQRIEAENARLKAENEAMRKASAAKATQARHDENVAFAESLIEDAKLKPKYKAVLVATLDALSTPGDDDKPVEFSEGDVTIPLAKALRGVFADTEPVVEFGERATKDRAGKADPVNPLLADAEARSKGA